jgi:hypothetical protein
MDKNQVKQHIINVLYFLINLADRFKLEYVSKELTACRERIISSSIDQVLKEEVVRYHTSEADD